MEAIPDRWFWVSATYKARSGNRRKRHLWERIVFLIRAPDAGEAARRAPLTALRHEHSYTGATGALVTWEFQAVERIEELFDESIQEGTQVYWEFYERVDRSDQ